MGLDMNTSLSMALSFTGSYNGPAPPLRTSSLRQDRPGSVTCSHSNMTSSNGTGSRGEISLYKGVSDRPLGWKPRRKIKLELDQHLSSISPKRWDGLARTKTNWDGLRRVNLHLMLIDW
jgi:hypothetical protein